RRAESVGIDHQLELDVAVVGERDDLVFEYHAPEAFEDDLRDVDVVLAHVLPEEFAGLRLVDGRADTAAQHEGLEIARRLNQGDVGWGYVRVEGDLLDRTQVRLLSIGCTNEQEDGYLSKSRRAHVGSLPFRHV